MARKIIEFIDCWQVYNKSLLRKTFVQANSSSLSYLLIALNQIWGSNFKSLNVSRSHSKHFEVSVSQSKKSKCLGLAKKNASLAVSQSLAFTIRHPSKIKTNDIIVVFLFFLIFIQLCDSRKIHYLTREFHVKLHLKTDIALIACNLT